MAAMLLTACFCGRNVHGSYINHDMSHSVQEPCYKETRWLGMHKQAGTRAGSHQRHTQQTPAHQRRPTTLYEPQTATLNQAAVHASNPWGDPLGHNKEDRPKLRRSTPRTQNTYTHTYTYPPEQAWPSAAGRTPSRRTRARGAGEGQTKGGATNETARRERREGCGAGRWRR